MIDPKDYAEFLENNNKILYEEIVNIRRESLKSTKCDSCDSFKIEVANIHETLSKFTKRKENLDLILSNQIPSFNKNVGFKPYKSLKKITNNRKNLNYVVYKFSLYKKTIHLDHFIYDKLRRSKGNNPRTINNVLTRVCK